MKWSKPAAAAFLGLVATSCQSLQTPGASRQEKTAALAAHLHEWRHPALVNQFAGPRTVQLFTNLALDPERNHVSATSTGLACLLSADGYALTATHLFTEGPVAVLQLKTPRPGRLELTPAGPVFTPHGRPDHSHRVSNRFLKTDPVRLVKRLPGADLALVHLPVTTTRTFQPADGPPIKYTTVFSYGSPLSGASSAGEVQDLSPRAKTWKLTTTIPLQKGDSGGPVMDPSGRLVAVISRGQTRLFSRNLSATIANGVKPEVLEQLIANDRFRAEDSLPSHHPTVQR